MFAISEDRLKQVLDEKTEEGDIKMVFGRRYVFKSGEWVHDENAKAKVDAEGKERVKKANIFDLKLKKKAKQDMKTGEGYTEEEKEYMDALRSAAGNGSERYLRKQDPEKVKKLVQAAEGGFEEAEDKANKTAMRKVFIAASSKNADLVKEVMGDELINKLQKALDNKEIASVSVDRLRHHIASMKRKNKDGDIRDAIYQGVINWEKEVGSFDDMKKARKQFKKNAVLGAIQQTAKDDAGDAHVDSLKDIASALKDSWNEFCKDAAEGNISYTARYGTFHKKRHQHK